MLKSIKKWWLTGLIGALLMVHPNLKAEPDVPSQLPNSASWINQVFQAGSSLTDISNPLNWVIYSAAGTYFYYHYVLKGSLSTASGARAALLMELRKTRIDVEEKERHLAEVEKLIANLKIQIAKSQKAYEDIPSHFQVLNSYKSKRDKTRFSSIKDYREVENWLRSEKGKKFLSTETGKLWLSHYEALKFESTAALEEPLRKVIEKVNNIIESPKAQALVPAVSRDQNGSIGVFVPEKELPISRNRISIKAIDTHVSNLEKDCRERLSVLAGKKKQLTEESSFVRFWTKKDNYGPAVKHGIVTVGGASATYWLSKFYKYDELKKAADIEEKLKGDGAFDLGSTLRLEPSRQLMQPYYESIGVSLIEVQEEIIKDLEKNHVNLEDDESTVRQLVTERLSNQVFIASVEMATLKVAKNRFGERTSFAALREFLEVAKTNPDIRDGVFRAFHKEVVQACINSLWAEFSVGNITEKISPETIRKVINRSEKKFWETPNPTPKHIKPV